MKWVLYIVMVVVTFTYLIIGAVVFHFLEDKNEMNAKRDFVEVHEAFLNNYTCITPEQLGEYVLSVLETQSKGVAVNRVTDKFSRNSTVTPEEIDELGTKWDMASSVLFCVTVISTIGYGNMSPKTTQGQLFCIFYALIGIPMFAVVLVGTGERLQIPIKKIHKGRAWFKGSPARDEQFKSIVLLSTGTFIIVFIPAIVFTFTQKWSFLESMYYTVITLTTIGFGDLVPGYFEKPAEGKMKKRHVVYRVFLGLWILFGLSWGALILSEIGSLMQKKITTAATETQNRLSKMEDIVRKKAKETKARIAKKDKEAYPTKNGKDLPEAEVCNMENESDNEELEYEPRHSDIYQ